MLKFFRAEGGRYGHGFFSMRFCVRIFAKNENWRLISRQFFAHRCLSWFFLSIYYHSLSKNKPLARMIYFALFFAKLCQASIPFRVEAEETALPIAISPQEALCSGDV